MTSTERPPRVIVIGNGPVGQTVALLLAQHEVPVLVLDARPARDKVGSKAICQQRDVLDIWASVGVGDYLAAVGVTWTTSRTYHRDAELFATEFTDSGVSPFPPFVNVSQTVTEDALDERMAASQFIDVSWGHRVVGLEQDDHGVTVVCDTAAGIRTVRGEYAVACPGARGDQLRTLLGVSFEGMTFGEQFLICDIKADLPHWVNERRFYFDPDWNRGRQVLIHPCPDEIFRIDWQVPENYDLVADERDGGLDGRIRAIIGDAPYEIVWKSVYRFHSRVADRFRVGRVLLAGDGAHLFSPFGARGLNSGVQDAENAAWKLAWMLKGWGSPALLDSYHAERHAAALENLAVTTATMKFLVPQTDEERQHRDTTLEAARYRPDARSSVDSGRLAEPFWYVESPLTTPDARRPFEGRPQAGTPPLPGPGVLIPDLALVRPRGGARRLRELLRGTVTMLTGSGVVARRVEQLASDVLLPVAVHAMGAVAEGLDELLGAEPDDVWIVRPDCHVAAVVPGTDLRQLQVALTRALGGSLRE